jgi:hypothetical protein
VGGSHGGCSHLGVAEREFGERQGYPGDRDRYPADLDRGRDGPLDRGRDGPVDRGREGLVDRGRDGRDGERYAMEGRGMERGPDGRGRDGQGAHPAGLNGRARLPRSTGTRTWHARPITLN